MLASLKPRPGKRWPRGQKFRVSPRGIEELLAYRDAVQQARALGRSALESAQQAWAERVGIQPADGVVLSELGDTKRGANEVATALESCGTSAAEVKAALDRLVDAQLVEAVPMSAQASAH